MSTLFSMDFTYGGEADTGLGGAVLDDFFQAGKGATADKQDLAGVDLQELLLRMLTAALRRHRGDGAFDQLEQRLLHAFPGHIAGDGGVFRLARNLVDFVDVDNAGLGLLHIVIALLQQLLDDVFHVLAHVTGFGQRGGIGNGERHVQHARQRFGQQGLARAGGTDEQDVALGQLDVFVIATGLKALVVVVHRHRRALSWPLPGR